MLSQFNDFLASEKLMQWTAF